MSLEDARTLLEEDAKNNIEFLIRVRDSEKDSSMVDKVRAAVTLARMYQIIKVGTAQEEKEDIGQIIVRMRRERGLPI